MIARLILMVLLACFALPAMASAPCHDGSAEMAGMAMPHVVAQDVSREMSRALSPSTRREPERKPLAVHACMGCIPPAMLLRATVRAPAVAAALVRRVSLVRFDRSRTLLPAIPPPRSNG